MASSFLRFLDHTQQRTTVGRTPLDEWSARRRDLYLTTHNSQQTNIHGPAGIRTHDLSRRAAADLRLRPRGHWDRLLAYLLDIIPWEDIYVMGLTNSPLCRRLGADDETSDHILCECEDLVSLKNVYLCPFFLEPEDINSISLGAIWNFNIATGFP